MNYQDKLEKYELHNQKLINHGQDPITFEQWDIGYYGAIVDHLQEEEEKKYKSKKIDYKDHIKNDSEIAALIKSFGGFYFNCYKNLLKLKIDKQYIFRFVYLCTMMNYDNMVTWGNAKNDCKLALEKDLMDILKLSKRETINTKQELIKHDLIIVNDDKTITVNKKFAVKGIIDKRKTKGSVRAMEQGIQELYNKAKPSEHKKLALLIELLPYINYNFNIICHNPKENEQSKIQPMSIKEICRVVGYNETNSNRLKKELLSLKVDNKPVVMISLIDNKHCISINPKIYYKGNDIKSLKYLIGLFEIFE